MSGSMIAAILLSVVPLVFPVIMQALGLITGLVQAYIFAVLAMVYIASATQAHEKGANDNSLDASAQNDSVIPPLEKGGVQPRRGNAFIRGEGGFSDNKEGGKE